jgi:hypothetical protein
MKGPGQQKSTVNDNVEIKIIWLTSMMEVIVMKVCQSVQ